KNQIGNHRPSCVVHLPCRSPALLNSVDTLSRASALMIQYPAGGDLGCQGAVGEDHEKKYSQAAWPEYPEIAPAYKVVHRPSPHISCALDRIAAILCFKKLQDFLSQFRLGNAAHVRARNHDILSVWQQLCKCFRIAIVTVFRSADYQRWRLDRADDIRLHV